MLLRIQDTDVDWFIGNIYSNVDFLLFLLQCLDVYISTSMLIYVVFIYICKIFPSSLRTRYTVLHRKSFFRSITQNITLEDIFCPVVLHNRPGALHTEKCLDTWPVGFFHVCQVTCSQVRSYQVQSRGVSRSMQLSTYCTGTENDSNNLLYFFYGQWWSDEVFWFFPVTLLWTHY